MFLNYLNVTNLILPKRTLIYNSNNKKSYKLGIKLSPLCTLIYKNKKNYKLKIKILLQVLRIRLRRFNNMVWAVLPINMTDWREKKFPYQIRLNLDKDKLIWDDYQAIIMSARSYLSNFWQLQKEFPYPKQSIILKLHRSVEGRAYIHNIFNHFSPIFRDFRAVNKNRLDIDQQLQLALNTRVYFDRQEKIFYVPTDFPVNIGSSDSKTALNVISVVDRYLNKKPDENILAYIDRIYWDFVHIKPASIIETFEMLQRESFEIAKDLRIVKSFLEIAITSKNKEDVIIALQMYFEERQKFWQHRENVALAIDRFTPKAQFYEILVDLFDGHTEQYKAHTMAQFLTNFLCQSSNVPVPKVQANALIKAIPSNYTNFNLSRFRCPNCFEHWINKPKSNVFVRDFLLKSQNFNYNQIDTHDVLDFAVTSLITLNNVN